MSRMFCYIWSETTNPNECKFGERWVKDGQDPETEVRKRVKESLAVRKDLLRDGTVQLNWFGDVTAYAAKVCPDRLKQHGRVDDDLRSHVGFRKGATGEVHELPADEMVIRVNKILTKAGQPLPEAGLSTAQYNVADDVLQAIAAGKRTIIAELCARFGKTIWSGAMIRELDRPLNIVASYVLTSFTSFIKDLTSYEQFKDFVHVDTKDDDYEQQIGDAILAGKQVIAYVSMCKGSKREERIEKLFSATVNRLLIIDEADYGVHKSGQADVLLSNLGADDISILMTGTNSDRAATNWEPGHFVSVTYPELLMEKALTLKAA